ncbi:hypothetical protein [Erythrobacter sp. R86502]|uniref:hypothetical protein n=1 Tax=Erythrobacter sp. R86502 TaxID=3093846 RepID=UPI0036D39695
MVDQHLKPTRTKWIWVAILVVFAVIAVAIVWDPSGSDDGTVSDPIVMDDTGEGVGVGQTPPSEGPAPEPFAPGGDPEG